MSDRPPALSDEDLLREIDEDDGKESAAPEAEESTDPDAEAQREPPPGPVPLGELQRERERRKEAEREARRLQETMARGNERLQELLGRFAPPQQDQTPPIPDFDANPAEHLRRRQEEADRRLSELAGRDQQQAQQRQFLDACRTAVAQFKRDHADYDAAYDHLMRDLADEAVETGFSPAEIETEIAARAFREGVNPAQRLYALAKRRGYTPQQQAQQRQQATADRKLDVLERGERAARSLPSGGAPAQQPITYESLANMSQAEFSRVYAKHKDRIDKMLRNG